MSLFKGGTLTLMYVPSFNCIGDDMDSWSMMEKLSSWTYLGIKEVMYIRVNDPPLNKNLGKLPGCYTFGMRFCKTCMISIYSDTPLSHLLHVLLGSPPLQGCTHISLVSMHLPGVPSLSYSPTSILVPNFPAISLVPNVSKFSIFSQTWRNIVNADIIKACLFFKYCILFAYYIGES